MTTLFLAAAAIAANVSLVVFAANLLTADTVTASVDNVAVASNENGVIAAHKLAA